MGKASVVDVVALRWEMRNHRRRRCRAGGLFIRSCIWPRMTLSGACVVGAKMDAEVAMVRAMMRVYVARLCKRKVVQGPAELQEQCAIVTASIFP
eukprot:1217084-Pyramimonas_sp.AAC.1